jgi:hypothetical protein
MRNWRRGFHFSAASCSIFVTVVILSRQALGQAAVTAAPATEEPRTRQVALEGQVGVVTPLGIFGLALDIDVVRWLSVRAGVGVDVFDREDLRACHCSWSLRQLALMPHFRYPVLGGGTSISLGLGISHDAAHNIAGIHSPSFREDNEVSIEHRFDDGVRVRSFVGLGFYLNEPNLPAFGGSVYFGAALGYAVWPNPTTPPNRSSLSLGRWYGWQILASDAAAAIVASQAHVDGPALRGAIAIYGIPGPIVHLAHRRYVRMAGSVALRVLVPLLLRSAAPRSSSGGAARPSPVTLAVAGVIIAALIDDFALGWGPASSER